MSQDAAAMTLAMRQWLRSHCRSLFSVSDTWPDVTKSDAIAVCQQDTNKQSRFTTITDEIEASVTGA